MITPATVGSQLTQGYRLAEIWCNPCSRHVKVPINDLPPDLPIPDICLRYRCAQCGGRQLSSRMSILEFYAVADARKLALETKKRPGPA